MYLLQYNTYGCLKTNNNNNNKKRNTFHYFCLRLYRNMTSLHLSIFLEHPSRSNLFEYKKTAFTESILATASLIPGNISDHSAILETFRTSPHFRLILILFRAVFLLSVFFYMIIMFIPLSLADASS